MKRQGENKMKKIVALTVLATVVFSMFTGCTKSGFDQESSISVVSREDGSGTRGAFIELFGIEEKAADGTKKDNTTKEAVIADKTDIMLTNISNNDYAIGYVSLGSLNDTVKALDVDGIKATTENVKNGEYKISRPFNIATKGEPTGLASDFMNFIFSKEGQEVVSKSYITIDDKAPAYSGNKPSGKIVVGGSSSVSPLMEKLIEAYKLINKDATIELQTNDSSTGMKDTISGTLDIGMASRELKDSEKAELKDSAIALDGIAVIVNSKNTLTNITTEQVNEIFTGKNTKWSEIIK